MELQHSTGTQHTHHRCIKIPRTQLSMHLHPLSTNICDISLLSRRGPPCPSFPILPHPLAGRQSRRQKRGAGERFCSRGRMRRKGHVIQFVQETIAMFDMSSGLMKQKSTWENSVLNSSAEHRW